ncbi:hypothetical protein [Aeromonas phage 4L372D]|uniref:Uncharacterized protein n=4 Tax=Plateaulakevirus TaxID=2843436 RepID=A0A5B9N784_9CAUD|nr:hypothetical protein HWC25_gp203 [Aeromonas phage 2L372D]YP_009846541.1 hypothetical protein HWC26_gp204 [Aeromonas phage 2L372X]YP_009846769.1 hypothetical protein HWC27_gp170 [Aeromonas phage 4L372D]YP_009846997.1 hypothetical protein HWC28_gp198 [Aeromonas phage 4L372XY]QDB74117.1 hypothetical protein 2L372D_203 [Aeromonas phage 2L372D]QEG08456.1 hypothetical protein [Aeromonas phage 2L372X]QEG08685.1 hypothetical protein [Aeromonas phage 4L372D]QEG08913.1 hypothetical protein [Aeromon
MTKHLDKIVSSMTDADWLQVHVISQANLFETKFNTRIDSQEIEDVCKTVADMKLPEGVDTYIAMLFLLPSIHNDYVYTDIAKLKMQGLTLGLDMLIYVYSQFCITDGYDEQVAFIFKNCIQYTIPF